MLNNRVRWVGRLDTPSDLFSFLAAQSTKHSYLSAMAWSNTLRKCNTVGCSTLVKRGHCPPHQEVRDLARAEQRKDYWATRKQETTTYRLYYTERWRELRRRHLLANPYCAVCGQKGNVVDHIVPHKDNEAVFFEGPFQTLCPSCHGRKTAREDGGFNNKRKGKD